MRQRTDHPEETVDFWQFFLLLLIWIPLIMLWIFTLTDLARRADLSGLAKGLWAVAVVFLPILGMIIYFIARPSEPEMEKDPAVRMAEIRSEELGKLDSGKIDQLEKLGDLKESGAITDEEFESMKKKLLG